MRHKWINLLYLFEGPCGEVDGKRGGCDQICIPLGDKATCHCDVGYTLNADKKTCDTSK